VDKIAGRFQPIAAISREKSFETDKKIIPVVFMTIRCFLNIKEEEISFLAKSIFDLIQSKQQDFEFENAGEIQIDFDWNSGTRDDYFKFLKELKRISGEKISCTLRLHQVKDKKETGVPPVEKVYLMCYSTSSPLENSDKNSILDVAILKNYLSKIEDYPIKNMDIALPIYSWGIVTNHVGKHLLINGLNKKDLENPNFRKISENEVEVLQDDFYFGNFLNKNFTIKIEEISDSQLEEVIGFLNKKLPKFNIIYFQLDGKFVENKRF
jgi:hypothetical protein